MARFEKGRVYHRQSELHDVYGGQQQGGISTPADAPIIFLFTGERGEEFGYEDGWTDDGIFLYTGEGQTGDMEFSRGNAAIRDHAANQKELHLFEWLGQGNGYRYIGQFACATWEYRTAPDKNGDERKAIVFHLVQIRQT